MHAAGMRVSLAMLAHDRVRLVATLAALAIAYLLCGTQMGLFVGWSNTTSALVKHAGADLWLVAEKTPCFDYGTAIPRRRLYQARSVDGVASADGMYVGFAFWQRPDGQQVGVELVGVGADDPGVPWAMRSGAPDAIHQPHTVVADALFVEALGVRELGDEVEISGRRATLGGISRDVRTFTSAPFVFTSLDNAMDYDGGRYRDEVTFVIVRAERGVDVEALRSRLERDVPGVEVLTTREFADRTVRHWMIETGAGLTVGLAAALGLVISIVVTSQTLVSVTRDHAPSYATMLALGVSRTKLVLGVLAQAGLLTAAGVALGGALLAVAVHATRDAAIPIEMTAPVAAGFALVTLAFSALSSLASCRAVLAVDPNESLRGA
jgi:putative ABC transport system permease protein